MITVNTYAVTQRAVYEGAARALGELMKLPSGLPKPDDIVKIISESILEEMTQVFDFGIQPVRLTPAMIQQLVVEAHEEQEQPAEEQK
jgi:hypothetical protein